MTEANKPVQRKLSKAGKRQLVLISAVAMLVLAVIMLAIKVAETNAPPPKAPTTKAKKTTLAAPGGLSDETVAAVTERRLAELQATIKLQEAEREKRIKDAELRSLREKEKPQPASGRSASSAADTSVSTGEPPRIKLFDASRIGAEDRPKGPVRRSTTEDGPVPEHAPSVTTLAFGGPSTEPAGQNPRPLAVIDKARTLPGYEEVGKALRSGSTASLNGPRQAEPMTSETYLPSGTFFRVSTMNGMDAPAGGQAQNNPQPVLMVVSDWGNMPNSFRANVKHCFVIGSAWGDLSAERAMARTESLSCIRPTGEVIDVPISGFVVGPDGRNGFRGRVVTKQGQVLANALWTGALGAFGDVAKELNKSPLVVSSGVLTQDTPTTSEILRRGALGGMGEAAKSLSQYYITLADKLYPVIETDAGLTAEIVLTRGVAIKDGQGQGTGVGPDLAGWAQSLKLPSMGLK